MGCVDDSGVDVAALHRLMLMHLLATSEARSSMWGTCTCALVATAPFHRLALILIRMLVM